MSHIDPNRPTLTPNRFIPSPKVRAWLYSIAAAGAPLLIGYGFLTVEQGGLWLGLAGAVLGVSGNLLAAGNVPSDD